MMLERSFIVTVKVHTYVYHKNYNYKAGIWLHRIFVDGTMVDAAECVQEL